MVRRAWKYAKIVGVMVLAGLVEDLLALWLVTGKWWIDGRSLGIIVAVALVFGFSMFLLSSLFEPAHCSGKNNSVAATEDHSNTTTNHRYPFPS